MSWAKIMEWTAFFVMVSVFAMLVFGFIYKMKHTEAEDQTWQVQQVQCIEQLSQRLGIPSASLGFALQQEGIELSVRDDWQPLGLSRYECVR